MFNVNLDQYGTAVWRLFDGKLTVREIGEILKTRFGDTVEPLYARLAAFLKILKTRPKESLLLQSPVGRNGICEERVVVGLMPDTHKKNQLYQKFLIQNIMEIELNRGRAM